MTVAVVAAEAACRADETTELEIGTPARSQVSSNGERRRFWSRELSQLDLIHVRTDVRMPEFQARQMPGKALAFVPRCCMKVEEEMETYRIRQVQHN